MKHFQYSHKFRKINNLKLPLCLSIIFPKSIQNLLTNFSEIFRRFQKNIPKTSTKSFQKCSQNFQHLSKVFSKYSKICFPKFTWCSHFLRISEKMNYWEDMPANNHEIITNINNRNTEMRCSQTLFSVNCQLANWSRKLLCEIQFNLQLL